MKKLLIILGLLFLTAGVQADVSGPTFLGTKLRIDAVYSGVDTIYTAEDFTGIITVGDVLVIRHDLENSTVSPWIAVVASEDPAYIELMGAWPGSDRTDGQAYFFHNNYQVMVGSAAGDGYDSYIDGSGNAVYTGDMNIQGDLDVDTDLNVDGAAVIDGTLRLGLNASLPDTTGFVGGETFYGSTPESLYVYTAEHTLGVYIAESISDHLTAAFNDSTATIPIGAGFSQITNAGKNLFTVIESQGITVSGDSLIALTSDRKRLRALVNVKGGAGDDYLFKFVAYGGSVISSVYAMEISGVPLQQTAVIFGLWTPSGIGDALTIEADDTGGEADLTGYEGYWEASEGLL